MPDTGRGRWAEAVEAVRLAGRRVWDLFGGGETMDAVAALLKEADENGDGYVDYDEFVSLLAGEDPGEMGFPPPGRKGVGRVSRTLRV